MKERLNKLKTEAKKNKNSFKKLIHRIKKKPPKNFDYLMLDIHEKVFSEIDCLNCANCCKTTSPIITEKDIQRISNYLRLKEAEFIYQYLKKDTDGEWMFQKTPCVFLNDENHCGIYEVRPKACREYPHLDRRKNIQLLNLHLKNAEICPAVFDAFQYLEKEISPRK